jgi:uncharacterized protein YraI
MKKSTTLTLAGTMLAAVCFSGAAIAKTVYATTHLNIRTGPGVQYPITGEMRWNSRGDVSGCLPDYSWCHITTNNGAGWSDAHYLIENTSRGTETVEKFGAQSGIPVIAAEVETVGAVVRVPAGTAFVEAVAPPEEVITYVSAQVVESVYLNGEIVIGAVLPEEVVLYEIPGSEYLFTFVNGAKVVVEVPTRKVIYIVR